MVKRAGMAALVLGSLLVVSVGQAQAQDLLAASGKITFLRAHDVGTGFGEPEDFIDVEAVIALDSEPGKAFGFQVREDGQRSTRRSMFDLLRDAFNNNWTVHIDYLIYPGRRNGVILRVAVTR